MKSCINHGFKCIGVDPHSKIEPDCVWHKSIDEIHDMNISVFIISTSSSFHYNYVDFIENNYKNVNVILEKPLFTSNKQYQIFKKIEKKSKNKYYVNLPFTYNGILKNILNENNLGHMTDYYSSGKNWGLCCNLLHDLSIISHFIKIKNSKVSSIQVKVDSEYESKRSSYYEINGELNFKIDKVNVNLSSSDTINYLKKSKILFERGEILISYDQSIKITSKNLEIKEYEFLTTRASDTTSKVVESLLAKSPLLPKAIDYVDVSNTLYDSLSKTISKKTLEYPFS